MTHIRYGNYFFYSRIRFFIGNENPTIGFGICDQPPVCASGKLSFRFVCKTFSVNPFHDFRKGILCSCFTR